MIKEELRFDFYRVLVNKYGKDKFWSMTPEEVCEALEKEFEEMHK